MILNARYFVWLLIDSFLRGHNAFAYIYEGEALFGDEKTRVGRGNMVVFDWDELNKNNDNPHFDNVALENLSSLAVKDLRRALEIRGISTVDCVEKVGVFPAFFCMF